VSDELNKMRMKEKYLNNQHNAMALSYVEVKHKLEGLEQKSAAAHEVSAACPAVVHRLLFFLRSLRGVGMATAISCNHFGS
jgi:hypothetical protein